METTGFGVFLAALGIAFVADGLVYRLRNRNARGAERGWAAFRQRWGGIFLTAGWVLLAVGAAAVVAGLVAG